jgi:hypothetical protein
MQFAKLPVTSSLRDLEVEWRKINGNASSVERPPQTGHAVPRAEEEPREPREVFVTITNLPGPGTKLPGPGPNVPAPAADELPPRPPARPAENVTAEEAPRPKYADAEVEIISAAAWREQERRARLHRDLEALASSVEGSLAALGDATEEQLQAKAQEHPELIKRLAGLAGSLAEWAATVSPPGPARKPKGGR